MDQAGAAEEGQRSAVSEPTPQEPRPVENAENSRIFLSSCVESTCMNGLFLNVSTARDSWKKKYFETKKATAPLEEKLRGLHQQLEMFYNKVLQQLQARQNRGKQRRQGRSSIKVTWL